MRFKVVVLSCLLLLLLLVTSTVAADQTSKEESKAGVADDHAVGKNGHVGRSEVGYARGYAWGEDPDKYGGGGGGGGGGGCRYGCCGGYSRRGGCRRCCYSAREAYYRFQNEIEAEP